MASYNLAALLENSATQYPDRDAIVIGDVRLTYDQVNGLANQVAGYLADKGIGRGDKVALMCPNLPYFSVIYFGILKAGAAVVPLNVLLKGREVAYHLGDSDARAIFAFEGTPELAVGVEAHAGAETAGVSEVVLITANPMADSPIAGVPTLFGAIGPFSQEFATVETDEDDTAVILYTSGTTGQPKGAELRHRNMRDNALASEHLFGANAERHDRYLAVLPLFHAFGQTVCQNGGFAFASTIVMLPRFEAGAALALLEKEKITSFAGVPTMYWGLLGALDGGSHDVDVAAIAANLRIAVAGGSALPIEIHHEFQRKFGVTILEGYGLSETSPIASFSVYGQPVRVGSIGVPLPGVQMKLVEMETGREIVGDPDAIGEIAIRGNNIFKGYYNRSEATAEVLDADGWFRSGDLGRRDDDGWYYIVDRAKELIIRGGFNVYPREIEEVLLTHPAISLAAVIGVPHESHGEEIKAVVVLKPGTEGSDEATPEAIVAWAKETMASYKYPRIVEIAQSLPMTATGKILKRELK